MKVLFIYPDIDPYIPNFKGKIHFGLASISAVLKQIGVETALLHITRDLSCEDIIEKVRNASCDLVAFSSSTNMFSYVVKYSLWISDKLKLPAICGGVHSTVAPEEAIRTKGLSMICIGEGEEAMAELCRAMERDEDIRNVKNIWIKDNGQIYRNPPRPLIKDLDSLPFYDWGLFDIKSLEDSCESIGNYLASRGCPFECSYCVNHLIKKIYSTENIIVRFQSVGRVIKEINALRNSYPFIRHLVFHDDTLVKNKAWFSEFAGAYKSQINLPYMCNARPELITETTSELLKDSGCARVWVGIESGNEEIRRNVLKRKMSQQKIKESFTILKRYGILTHTFNMVGIPYEDSKKVLETIKLNAEIGASGMQTTIFYPYPNTELYELCKKEGFLSNKIADDYRTRSILSLPAITNSQIEFFAAFFAPLTKLYRFFYNRNINFNGRIAGFVDNILTSRFFPYEILAVSHRIFFNILKFVYVKFIRKFYQRKGRLFKVNNEMRDRRKRLLFVITSSDGGGAQKHLYELAELLDKERYTIEVACAPGGPLVERLDKLGIKVFPVPTLHNAINPGRDLRAFIRIFRLIKDRKYDIVHCHSTKAGILGRIAARLAGVPAIVFTAHGFAFREKMFLPKKLLLIFMEKIAAICCHLIITVSENDRKAALKLGFKKPSKTVTIHNGIDLNFLKKFDFGESDRIRERLGLDRKSTVIGTIANFNENKGYPYLLQAARLISEKDAGVRFVSVGDGPLRNEMLGMAQSLGLEEKFIFAGYQPDPLPLLSIMDAFVLSSIKEGLPYCILEAMALGKPVVATEVGGVPEIVSNHKTGMLARPADSDSLAKNILTVIKDKSLRERLARNGRERVNDFNIRYIVEKIDNLYKTLLNNKKASYRERWKINHSLNGWGLTKDNRTIKESKIKRLFDIGLSSMGIFFSSPLWLLFSLAIRLEDGGPVFYTQKRMGNNGRIFKICKFRSMVPDAEKLTGAVWASENDPRVTKTGRLLRKTAMDELPQLFNIFKGDMSFVGPRAERPELVEEFSKKYHNFKKRLIVKPGLTGMAQVYGSYDSSPHQKLRFDLLYIKKQSFWIDLKLFILSFYITFRGKWESREKKIFDL